MWVRTIIDLDRTAYAYVFALFLNIPDDGRTRLAAGVACRKVSVSRCPLSSTIVGVLVTYQDKE